jgi:hypothetical protein
LGHDRVTVTSFEAEYDAPVVTIDHLRPSGDDATNDRRRQVVHRQMGADGGRPLGKSACQCRHCGGLEERGDTRCRQHRNITAAESDRSVVFPYDGFDGRREARLDHDASLGIGRDQGPSCSFGDE